MAASFLWISVESESAELNKLALNKNNNIFIFPRYWFTFSIKVIRKSTDENKPKRRIGYETMLSTKW